MDVRGRPVNFHDKARFLVEIPGFAYAGFQDCSDIQTLFAKKQYNDGASPTAFKKPGKEEYPPVTFTQGSSENDDIEQWYEATKASVRGYGGPPDSVKKDITIAQIDETGARVREVVLFRAHISMFIAGQWDANDKEGFVIKSMEVEYDENDVFRS